MDERCFRVREVPSGSNIVISELECKDEENKLNASGSSRANILAFNFWYPPQNRFCSISRAGEYSIYRFRCLFFL